MTKLNENLYLLKGAVALLASGRYAEIKDVTIINSKVVSLILVSEDKSYIALFYDVHTGVAEPNLSGQDYNIVNILTKEQYDTLNKKRIPPKGIFFNTESNIQFEIEIRRFVSPHAHDDNTRKYKNLILETLNFDVDEYDFYSLWANNPREVLLVRCSYEIFSNFLIRRNELGLSNDFVNLKAQII